MLQNLITVFFVINALFWGLTGHGKHCALAGNLGITNCPPHYIHLLMGIVSFFIAVYIQQRKYIHSLL